MEMGVLFHRLGVATEKALSCVLDMAPSSNNLLIEHRVLRALSCRIIRMNAILHRQPVQCVRSGVMCDSVGS